MELGRDRPHAERAARGAHRVRDHAAGGRAQGAPEIPRAALQRSRPHGGGSAAHTCPGAAPVRGTPGEGPAMKKKAPAPKRPKTLARRDVTNIAMTAGNENKISQIILDGVVKEW